MINKQVRNIKKSDSLAEFWLLSVRCKEICKDIQYENILKKIFIFRDQNDNLWYSAYFKILKIKRPRRVNKILKINV